MIFTVGIHLLLNYNQEAEAAAALPIPAGQTKVNLRKL